MRSLLANTLAKVPRRVLSTQLDPVQEALMKEECLLVDETDKVTGSASKRHCHQLDAEGKSPLHRAFSIFLFDAKDRLLLQQRSDAKITFPGLWTNTCCSHPLAVESEMDTSQEAIGKIESQLAIASSHNTICN